MKKTNRTNIACVTHLNRQQIDFLDKITKDYRFKYGHRLARSQILSELVTLLMHLGIDVNRLDLEHKELWQGLLSSLEDNREEK
ncbi:MAG: hypothetical protein GF333_03750 [Candidatus Omnitrophica bacterium]|nr:hypothetical protein [Candidatus Omnitrophota bacterium]